MKKNRVIAKKIYFCIISKLPLPLLRMNEHKTIKKMISKGKKTDNFSKKNLRIAGLFYINQRGYNALGV